MTIDFGDREMIPDIRVDRIGEVDRSGSLRKSDDISLWGEDEDLI